MHPAVLFALTAVLLPLLIHLFTRSRSRTIPFSTLRFLLELQQQKIRKLKLRQILLLLVRTLIVLALVLGFARPTCRSHSPTSLASRAKTTAVIILDNSFSMGCLSTDRSLFDQSVKIAASLTLSFQSGDDVYLVTTTDTTREQSRNSFQDLALLRKQIEQLSMDARPTRFDAALHFADRLLASSNNLNKELYLIADFQKSGFSSDSVRLQPGQVRRFAIPVTARSFGNLSCNQVQLVSTILQKDKLVEGKVQVHNSGSIAQHNRLVQIYINQKQVAQATIDLEPGTSAAVPWKCMLDQTGFQSGYALLEDDDWLEDNKSYFCFNIPENVRIGLLGSETADGYFLQLGLRPDRTQPSSFVIQPVKAEQLVFQQPESYDVMALCDVPFLSAEMVEWLFRFVESGKGLLLVLGPHMDLKSFNQGLNSRLDLPLFMEVIGSSQNRQTSFSFGKADFLHPIFSGLFEAENLNLGDPVFYFAIRCQSTPAMNKIINFSSGDPFLYEVRRPEGAVLVFAAGFDDKITDLPYRAIFAPLMHRCVSYINAASRQIPVAFAAGDLLRFRLPADALGKPLLIQRPDQKQDRPAISTSRDGWGRWVEYINTDRMGIYQLHAENVVLNQWAVNLPDGEADLTPMDRNVLKRKYHFRLVEHVDTLIEEIQQERIGRELWKYFLIAALLLLLVEMALYYEKGQQ